MSGSVDLVKLFSTVAETMVENQASLNQADEYNQDHGDHMVEIFQLITGAVKESPKDNLSEGLSTASELLTGKKSGSADMYAKGLAQAAEYFQGQDLDATQLLPLLQTMLGGGEATVEKGAGGLSEEDRIAKLEEDLKRLEKQTNFRLLLVALAALAATILAAIALCCP